MTSTVKKVHLNCACCGKYAGKHKQYFNQDNGYGICSQCAEELTEKYGAEYVREMYGVKGLNYG